MPPGPCAASVPGVPGDFDTFQTARATAAAIKARQVSPVEVLDACLARVDAVNDRLNAVIWRNDDEAREAARAADAVVKSSPEDLPALSRRAGPDQGHGRCRGMACDIWLVER